MPKYSIRGGVHPLENCHGGKTRTSSVAIRPHAPSVVELSMSLFLGRPSTPLVKVGDHVKLGQKIGESGGFVSLPVHASVSGEVISVKPQMMLMDRPEMTVTIRNDMQDEWIDLTPLGQDVDSVEPSAIIPAIQEAGICGLGGAALSVALSAVIESSGWRTAFDISAALLFVSAAVVFLVLRDHPREHGLEPYRALGVALPSEGCVEEGDAWDGEPMTRLVRRPFFYLTMAAMTLCSVCMYGAFSTFVVHVQDQGLSTSVAAACNSLLLLGLAVAKIVVGAVCDRAAAHKAATFCLLCGVASILLLAGTTTVWQAVLAAVLLAFGLCMVGIVQPMLTMEMFGKKAYTSALGVMLAVTSGGNIAVAPLVNFAYDRTGSYSHVLFALGLVAAITTGLFLLAFHIVRLLRRQQARQMQKASMEAGEQA